MQRAQVSGQDCFHQAETRVSPSLWTTWCTAPVWPTQHTHPLCVPQHSKHIKGGLCSKLSGIHCPMCRQQQHHHCSPLLHLYRASCLCSSIQPLLLFPTYHKICLLKNSPLCQVDRLVQVDLQGIDKTDAKDKGSYPRLMADMGQWYPLFMLTGGVHSPWKGLCCASRITLDGGNTSTFIRPTSCNSPSRNW